MIGHIILGTELTRPAYIYLEEMELNHLKQVIPEIKFLRLGENKLTETQLEEILYFLPTDSFMHDYFQKAGQNIFGWKRW
jgi:hypothetical protein